eukprot:8399046-Ditylum_brightwellii.AAC.1
MAQANKVAANIAELHTISSITDLNTLYYAVTMPVDKACLQVSYLVALKKNNNVPSPKHHLLKGNREVNVLADAHMILAAVSTKLCKHKESQ